MSLPTGVRESAEWLALFGSSEGVFARLPYELRIQ